MPCGTWLRRRCRGAPKAGVSRRAPGLAFDQRKLARIVTVDMEKVEGEVSEWRRLVILKPRLQVGKACGAVGGQDADLAIERESLGGERGNGVCDWFHAMRPVKAFAGKECYLCSRFAGLDPVAVQLEFMEPTVVVRGSGGLEG